jgi:hypothetical protein
MLGIFPNILIMPLGICNENDKVWFGASAMRLLVSIENNPSGRTLPKLMNADEISSAFICVYLLISAVKKTPNPTT